MPARVFVGGLPMNCKERDIERFFKGYGRIRDVIVKNGYGFVDFVEDKDADDAVHDLDGRRLDGKTVKVERAKDGEQRGGGNKELTKRPPKSKYRIYVENCDPKTNWQDLKDFFRCGGGEVTFTDVHTEQPGLGVVEFADKKGLKYALDHRDRMDLHGRKLLITEDRSGRRSRSRSKSRDRHRKDKKKDRWSRSRTRSRTPN